LEYVCKTYTFEATDTELTLTDLTTELNKFYFEEGAASTIQKLVEEAKRQNIDPIEMLDRTTKEFNGIRHAISRAYSINLTDDVDKIGEEYVRVSEGGSFVKTGFKPFDDIVCPKTGNLVILCAPTKGGKTTTMVKMLTNCLEQGVDSLYFSLEMGLIEITNRILTNTSEYNFRQLHFGKVPVEDYKAEIKKYKGKAKVDIVTKQSEARIDIPTIERYIIEKKPKIVFIDYLSLIDGANQAWDAAVSPPAELKSIALREDVLIILAAQADTETMKGSEVPKMTNLRGNKGHAFDCDVFLGVRGMPYLLNDGDDSFRYAFEVSGSRNGGMPEWTMRVKPNRGDWQYDDENGDN
jgi:replicative DNA helicase